MFKPEPKGNEGEVSQSTFLLASGRTSKRGEGSQFVRADLEAVPPPKEGCSTARLTVSQAVTFGLFPGGDMEKVLEASSLAIH